MRTTASDVRRDRNQVAALANGMRAIEAFAASRQRMTLAEVAKHSGLTRAAARRYLLTLVAAMPILMASAFNSRRGSSG